MQLSDYEYLYKGASYQDGKILLRELSDMTEEEITEVVRIEKEYPATESLRVYQWSSQAEQIKYLLSKYFDLFGLIESGIAINKNNQASI